MTSGHIRDITRNLDMTSGHSRRVHRTAAMMDSDADLDHTRGPRVAQGTPRGTPHPRGRWLRDLPVREKRPLYE